MIRSFVLRTVLHLGHPLGALLPNRPTRPIFVLGYNNSGKSSIVSLLARDRGIKVFPGEGNDILWFPGNYPWVKLDTETPPLWASPHEFLERSGHGNGLGIGAARRKLGLYEFLSSPSRRILNDSGMLAALVPSLIEQFPDCQIVHVVRDGRVVSALSAEKTMRLIRRYPQRYESSGCPTDPVGVLVAQARYWTWTLDQVSSGRDRAPDRILDIRYEDWCAEPEGTLQRVARFLGTPGHIEPGGLARDLVDHNPGILDRIPPDRLHMVSELQAVHLERYGYA